MDEKVVESAMAIILNAGDARNYNKKALEEIAKFNYEEAKAQHAQAKEKIVLAHKVQTESIQEETRGKDSVYSLLFAHAQDTLMTVYSELNIGKELIDIFEAFDKRLGNIESKLGK